MADVAVTNNPEKHRFEAVVEGHLAIAEYNLIKDGVVFTHTEVPQALEGKGVGSALVKAGLAWARAEKIGVTVIAGTVGTTGTATITARTIATTTATATTGMIGTAAIGVVAGAMGGRERATAHRIATTTRAAIAIVRGASVTSCRWHS